MQTLVRQMRSYPKSTLLGCLLGFAVMLLIVKFLPSIRPTWLFLGGGLGLLFMCFPFLSAFLAPAAINPDLVGEVEGRLEETFGSVELFLYIALLGTGILAIILITFALRSPRPKLT